MNGLTTAWATRAGQPGRSTISGRADTARHTASDTPVAMFPSQHSATAVSSAMLARMMTLALTALRAERPTRLANIGSWRVKETDRIAAMATELAKLGARVESGATRCWVSYRYEPHWPSSASG
jgi:5-enolpyruvylshikimate-3-phosphate synthase